MMMTHALFNCTIVLFSIKVIPIYCAVHFVLFVSMFYVLCFNVTLVTSYLYTDLSGVFVVNAGVSGVLIGMCT